jgi:hypothetical protein
MRRRKTMSGNIRHICGVLIGIMGSTAFGTTPLKKNASYEDKGVVYLNQGWSEADRQAYYWTSQGSALLSYDIFLSLEQARSTKPFLSTDNLARLGMVPQEPDPKWNPDGLPLGWTKTSVSEGQWKGDWFGITCAACHNSQIEYKGKKIRIDGGNSQTFDLHAFLSDLDESLTMTLQDDLKFARLSQQLAKRGALVPEDLRARLQADSMNVARIRHFFKPTSPVGPGRMDALELVHNQVLANELGYPENWKAPNAPVKWPFLWNAPQSAWIGWRGTQQFPLLRNMGESMGFWVKFDIRSKSPDKIFDSTADLKGQIAIESLLRRLAPPPWPEEIFGRIDRVKAAKGAELFQENCTSCHSTYPHRWSGPKKMGKRFIENALIPAEIVGTDFTQVTNLTYGLNPTAFSGALAPYLPGSWKNADIAPDLVNLITAVQGVTDKSLAKLQLSPEKLEDASGYRFESEPLPPNSLYKAAPRDGSWAIAPYLHNGSVPNLYELLIPASQRSKQFYLGREFDPIKVGMDTSPAPGKFLFDTTVPGNSNAGHSFEDGPRKNGVIGRLLKDEERWALIEYLKSIPSQGSEIAPFGGPSEPIEAWQDSTFYHVQNPGGYQSQP